MPIFIASYDLVAINPSPYAEFIKQAAAQGWVTWILSTDGKNFRLPNTTLVGTFASFEAAQTALEGARARTSTAIGRTVQMPKWIITEQVASRFQSDEFY